MPTDRQGWIILVLTLGGLLVIVASHVWMLAVKPLKATEQRPHAWLNLAAVGALVLSSLVTMNDWFAD